MAGKVPEVVASSGRAVNLIDDTLAKERRSWRNAAGSIRAKVAASDALLAGGGEVETMGPA